MNCTSCIEKGEDVMLYFILGRVKSGKTSFLINEIQKQKRENTLFLVPETYSHSMERLLCEICGNPVSSYAEVTNFRRLATKIKSELGGLATETITGGKRILLLHSAIASCLPALSGLGKAVKNPDRLSDVLLIIDEFKAYGVTPEEIMSAKNEVSESLGVKLSDLAIIYAAYEANLSEGEYDAYDELSHTAKLLGNSDFWKERTLFLDGFSGFNAAEYEIFESAAKNCRDVYIALELCDGAEEEDENGIFDNAIKTRKKLLNICEKCGIAYEEIHLEKPAMSAIEHLDRAIYSGSLKPFEGDASEITVTSASGSFEECELAAAYILDKVRNGARFRDFSVALADSGAYLGICERVFSRYGIPVYMSEAEAVTSKPVIALILAALECALRGFRTDSVMEYIKTGFSGISSGSLDIFENYLYMWSPSPKLWAKGEDFVKNPLGLTALETEESAKLLRIINRVRRKVYEPIKRLSVALSRRGTGEDFAKALYDFINEINLPRRCNAYAYIAESSGRMNDAREYESITKILYEAIDSLGRVFAEKTLTKEEFCHLFRIVISQYELATIPTTLDSVSVEDISRADGSRCRFRIILGAVEGVFPRGSDGGGLLSENDRQELSDCGIELAPGELSRIFEEYRTVHDTLCSGEEGLYISYSTLSQSGELLEEAAVVSRIKELYNIEEKSYSLQEVRNRAKIPFFDSVIASGEACSSFENDAELSEKLRTVKENRNNSRGPVRDKENIRRIFGEKIKLSASRADLFASCRYAYFMKYGLYAKPHEKAEISAIEAGSLMHYVLENVIKKLSEEGNFDVDKAVTLSKEYVGEYVKNALSGAGEITGRTEFLIKRLERTVCEAVSDICRELKKSSFRPVEFELSFSKDGDLPPLEIEGENSIVEFRGAVDRVDTYEKDGKLYFRVIDYKSGKKEFSLDETVNGIGMQMLLYLFALEEMGVKRFGKEASPAGVMYVPLTVKLSDKRGTPAGVKRREGVVLSEKNIIDAMEIGEEKLYIPVSFGKNGEFKRGSNVLSGRELSLIKERVRALVSKIGDELSLGEVSPNPYVNKSHTACDWCDYKSVCAFDEKRTDDSMRELIEIRASDILEKDGGEEDVKCALDE